MKRDPLSAGQGDAVADPQNQNAPLASLYARWRTPVMRMLRRHFGNSAAVEDAAQEVFTRVAATGRVLESEQEQPYLRQTVRSVAARDWHKGPQVHGLEPVAYEDCEEQLHTISAEGYGDTESQAEHRQRLSRLHDAIEELPARQREAFVLHRIEGHTIDETAERMAISTRMVVKHLGRALAYCETRVLFTSAEQMKRLQAAHTRLSDEEEHHDDAYGDPRAQEQQA